MRRLLLWIVGLLLLIVLSYSAEIPELVMAYSPKAGRVIDVATGKGIPGVAVSAGGYFYSGGLFQGSQGCTFTALAFTDDDGRYWVPGGWRYLSPGLPIFDPHNTWNISAIKPGYVFVGDKDRVLDPNRPTPPTYGTVANPMTSSWRVFFVSVSDMVMEKVHFSIKEKLNYYYYMGGAGGCISPTPERLFRMHRLVFDDLKSDVCTMNPEERIETKTVLDLAQFSIYLGKDSRGGIRFGKRMINLDPAFKDVNPMHPPAISFRAGDVCQVMTAMGNDP